MREPVAVVFVLLVLAFCVAIYSQAARHRKDAIGKIKRVAHMMNLILVSWADFATNERIEGLPVEIDMQWSDEDLGRLVTAIVSVRYRYQDTRYTLVRTPNIDRTDLGMWGGLESFSFKLESDLELS